MSQSLKSKFSDNLMKYLYFIETPAPRNQRSTHHRWEIIADFSKDLGVGKQVLNHYMASSYQQWDQG